jgi:sugar lactone lactonase YvrE
MTAPLCVDRVVRELDAQGPARQAVRLTNGWAAHADGGSLGVEGAADVPIRSGMGAAMKRLGRRAAVGALTLVAAAWMAPAAMGDVQPATVLVGIDNPRGLVLGPDGSVYYAEAGRGGSRCNTRRTECMGTTSTIGRIDPSGRVFSVGRGFPSFAGADGTGAIGVDDVAVAPDGTVYTVVTSARRTGRTPKGLPRVIARQAGRVIRIRARRAVPGASIDRVEFTQNPDGQVRESNPYSIAVLNGKVYVTDAAGNDLLEVSGSGARVLTVFPNATPDAHSVPTVVRPGPDGALYVGELTGEKAPNGAARIWRVDPATGRKTVYASGLSRVTGLAFAPDGSLFVSELTKDFARFTPGDLVRIPPGGGPPQLFANLLSPTGIAIRGRTLFVSVSSVGTAVPAPSGPYKGLTGRIVSLPF